MRFLGVERSANEVWDIVRFNTSLWASISLVFYNHQLGLILLDWSELLS